MNLSEVIIYGGKGGLSDEDMQSALQALPLTVIDFDLNQAYPTGLLFRRTRDFGLSFGDCACITLAAMYNLSVVTAERRWVDAQSLLPAKVLRVR